MIKTFPMIPFFKGFWGFFSGVLVLLLAIPLTTSPTHASVQNILSELKKRASEKSYDIQAAQATLDQKRAQYYTSWSRWIPKVDLQLSRIKSRDFSIIASGSLGSFADFFTPQAVTYAQWNLSATAPLYQRSIHIGIQQSNAEKEFAEHQFQTKLSELDWRLRSLLGNYLYQVYRNATLDTSIRLAETGLKDANLRFKIGKNTVIDVLRSQANLASFQSERLSQEQQITSAKGDLLEYAGISEKEFNLLNWEDFTQNEEKLSLAIDEFTNWESDYLRIKPFLDPENAAEAQLDAQIARQSPGFKTASLRRELSYSQSRNLTVREWPDLRFQASLFRQYNEMNPEFNPNHPSYSFGLVLVIPIFSGGSLISSNSEQSASNRTSQLQAEKEILRVKNEIEKEITGLRSSLKTIEAQKLLLQQNEEIVRLSFKSYHLGKTTIVELLGSQQDLIRSKTNLAKTKIDISVLMKQLAWNLGVP